jgi:hypothetical protein
MRHAGFGSHDGWDNWDGSWQRGVGFGHVASVLRHTHALITEHSFDCGKARWTLQPSLRYGRVWQGSEHAGLILGWEGTPKLRRTRTKSVDHRLVWLEVLPHPPTKGRAIVPDTTHQANSIRMANAHLVVNARLVANAHLVVSARLVANAYLVAKDNTNVNGNTKLGRLQGTIADMRCEPSVNFALDLDRYMFNTHVSADGNLVEYVVPRGGFAAHQ